MRVVVAPDPVAQDLPTETSEIDPSRTRQAGDNRGLIMMILDGRAHEKRPDQSAAKMLSSERCLFRNIGVLSVRVEL